MGGYKKHPPMVYVVQWPDGVVKVGYTEKQRWRKFVLLGAELIGLFQFESHVEAFTLEALGLAWLRRAGELAFETIEESQLHVGPDGGGYAECYRMTRPNSDAQALIEHMLEHCPSTCLGGA